MKISNKKNIKGMKTANSMANVSQKWLNGIDSTTLEIAGIFTNGYNKKLHGSEIARLLKIPQRTVSRKLDYLCILGALKYSREGKNKLYCLDKSNSIFLQFITMTELFKTLKFIKKNILIGQLFNDNLYDSIIFGSYAKGINKQNSDIDIVFLHKNNKKIEEFIDKSPIEIHAHYSDFSSLKQKLNDKDSLGMEIRDNHILFGNVTEMIKIFSGGQND
ncbi:hypothetical protein COU57_03215 [Candidatus Pacearchaeota archaeon CG10_big_fil_rev_8_21_14_0_10_32_14]|nr:MAG: hypothetical protein COU57_03215 [Candidatus Pacearchaeota archaeon CG10_big_fil_rev_8_21_14_0_10_32_14]